MRRRIVIVSDKMQRGYRYVLSAPAGRDFDPQFRPDLTPSRCSNSACSAANTSPIVVTSFPRVGSRGRSSRLLAATAAATIISAWTRANACRNGEERAGYIRMIRAAGSSGIVGTT